MTGMIKALLRLLLIAIHYQAVFCSISMQDSLGHDDTASASLKILSTGDPLRVYDDTLFLGTTPIESLLISPGRHIFRCSGVSERSWFQVPYVETLAVRSGDQVARMISLPTIRHVTSEPYNAVVYLEDSIIGHTPCFFFIGSGAARVFLRKEGFEEVQLPVTSEGNQFHIVLSPLHGSGIDQTSAYLVGNNPKSDLPIYVATATTVAAGACAAFFKIKSDNYYSDYLQTGDSGRLSRVRTLDRISAVSLAASEISLVVLTYLLFSR